MPGLHCMYCMSFLNLTIIIIPLYPLKYLSIKTLNVLQTCTCLRKQQYYAQKFCESLNINIMRVNSLNKINLVSFLRRRILHLFILIKITIIFHLSRCVRVSFVVCTRAARHQPQNSFSMANLLNHKRTIGLTCMIQPQINW